jgi:hypothetical protein
MEMIKTACSKASHSHAWAGAFGGPRAGFEHDSSPSILDMGVADKEPEATATPSEGPLTSYRLDASGLLRRLR